MKIAKILLLFLTLIIVSASALAYSVNIGWTMNQPNYEVELYPCSNSVCSSVGSRVLYDTASGYTYNMYYVASGNAYHAAYFYKPGYRPIGYTLSSWGDWSTSFSSSFTKKDYCESTIGTLSVSDSTPTIGDTIIITAPISSAFTASDDNPQSPRYYPSSHIDYFTSDIDALLKAYDSDENLVMTLPSQTKSIYQEGIQSVSFNLDTTSLPPGDYRIVLSTDPVDIICDQNNKLLNSKELLITASSANTPPDISGIPNLSFVEDSGLHDKVIDLWAYASDAETSDSGLTFTITSQTNLGVVICTIDSNRYIDCTTQTNQNGYSDVTVQVEDPQGLTDTDTFRVTVTEALPTNTAPVIEGIPDILFIEDSGLHDNAVDLWSYAYDAETSDSGLTFTIISESNSAVVDCNIDSNRYIDCTTQTNQNGYSDVTVQVEDPQGLTDTDTFRVTAIPVNDAPVISNIPGQTIDSCHQFATFDLDDIVSDVDDNDAELTWTVTGNTRLIIVIDSTTHIVTITYPLSFTGSETLTFTATDPEGLTDLDTATFTVTACASNNTAPELSNIPDKELEEDSGLHDKVIDLWAYASDNESSDSELDFSITEQTNTNLVTCSISSDRYVDCKVKDGKTGVSYVTVEVRDPAGLTDADTFKVTVEKADSEEDDESGLRIMSVSYDNKVKAGDYMRISIDVKGLEEGIITTVRIDDLGIYETFNKISGIHVLIPESTKPGIYDFQISVKNDDGYKDSVYRDLEVISKTSGPNAGVANENENDEQITGASVVVTETASGNTTSEGQTSFNLEGILGLMIGLIFLLIVLGVLAIFYVFRNGKGNKKTGLAKNVYYDSTKTPQQPVGVPSAMPFKTFHGAEETEKFIYGSQQPSSNKFLKKT